MKKYILKGLTQEAKKKLYKESIRFLESKIGKEATLYKKPYLTGASNLFSFDGDMCPFHSDYLIIEEVIEDMNPEGKELALKDKIINEILKIEYHAMSLGCGLEDRNITDRYEAMKYGYYQAIEKVMYVLRNADIYKKADRSDFVITAEIKPKSS